MSDKNPLHYMLARETRLENEDSDITSDGPSLSGHIVTAAGLEWIKGQSL